MSTKVSMPTWNPELREEVDGKFSVQSEKAPGIRYTVDLASKPACNCPSGSYRPGTDCKHLTAVREHVTARAKGNPGATKANTASPEQSKEREEFLAVMEKSIPRLRELSMKANALGCSVLVVGLTEMAVQLEADIAIQRRALSDDPKIREAALTEAELPFRIL
jgi:uncharacterized Zn finger protein